jgi:hypothetical protein
LNIQLTAGIQVYYDFKFRRKVFDELLIL